MTKTVLLTISLVVLTSLGAAAQPPVTPPTPTSPPVATDARERAALELAVAAAVRDVSAQAVQAVEAVQAAQAVEAAQAVRRPQATTPAATDAARAQREVLRQVERVRTSGSREQRLYADGTAALDANRWDRAVELFTQVIALKDAKADAALYWKAYAQNKLGQRTEAIATLKELRTGFPASRWLKEAQALDVEMKGTSGGVPAAESNEDDELKLLALNSLMANNSEEVIPVLERMLQSQRSPKLKKRALFVLSQNRSPKARDIVASVARGSSNPDLQMEAIQYLGVFGGTENQQLMSDIYASSQDKDVKRRILQAYMVSGQHERLLTAAKSEADPGLRKDAIRMLGAQHATAALWQLYQAEISIEVKRAVIQGFMVSADVEHLVQVARAERDATLRLDAIRMLGVQNRGKTGAVLAELYWAEGQNKDIKREIVNGLFVQGNVTALVAIARKEADPDLRKALVQRLSLMKSKEATDFLMELINK